MKKLSKLVSLMLSLVLCLGMAAPAFAIEYKIEEGTVYVENDENGNTLSWQKNHAEYNSKETASKDQDITVTGKTEKNWINVSLDENAQDTTITLKDLEINVKYVAPLTITTTSDDPEKKPNVTVEVEGTNSLKTGRSFERAGLELNNGASVTITGKNGAKLEAIGGDGAGIGSGYKGTAGDIAISGEVEVKASGAEGAGIGGGWHGTAGNINISGSAKVSAAGGGGSGIGSGTGSPGANKVGGTVGNITISDNANVTASSKYGAGIGSGVDGEAGNINISGSAKVTATATRGGTGIGSGQYGKVGDINIFDNADVTAAGSTLYSYDYGGVGIGAGYSTGIAGDINISGSAKVTATAAGENSGAGIGTGRGSLSSVGNINISGNANVTATATGNSGAGIGPTFGKAGDINISGNADVTATGGKTGAGIGTGEWGEAGNITICGTAKVTATHGEDASNDIGVGKNGTVGTIINRNGEGHGYQRVETKSATCTEDGMATYTCEWCGDSYTETISAKGHDYVEQTADPTCTEDGETAQVCKNCGDKTNVQEIPATGHSYDDCVITKAATCTEDGEMTYTCSSGDDSYTEVISATGHTPGEAVHENEVAAQVGVEGSYDEVVYCSVCGHEISRETMTTEPLDPPETPDVPDVIIPDPDVPMADGSGADAATIEDQAVPLAGLMPTVQLLEELRLYEKIEDVELPEDFKWIDHEYAQAICWALREELVVDTEEEPFDPDEVLTVGVMREVLANFVELYLGLEDFVVTLEGEDDEMVMDLGERLDAFYAELDAALKAQEDNAA